MKIVLCGSLAFTKEFDEIKERLEKGGHLVLTSDTAEDAKKRGITDVKKWLEQMRKFESDKFVKYMAEKMKSHMEKIKSSDAILVVNLDKNGVKNYIGASALMQIGYAFEHGKRIYLLNPLNESISGADEIIAMKSSILNGRLEMIRIPTM
ncbi:MAG: hypothetical protein WA139_01720 [Candidatus Aenigmatarchaeota archaeon]